MQIQKVFIQVLGLTYALAVDLSPSLSWPKPDPHLTPGGCIHEASLLLSDSILYYPVGVHLSWQLTPCRVFDFNLLVSVQPYSHKL